MVAIPTKTLIVIVSYNAKRYMQDCIFSIRSTLDPSSYKIVVVDNASTDGIAQWLSEQSDILFIGNSKNMGFGPACNQAVASTRGTEYEDYDVFLLNNDTVLCQGSLDKLRRALYSSAKIGAVGAMSNYAGNRQQIDISFASTEEYVKFGENLSVPEVDRYMEKTRLNGFALLIRRSLWDSVSGFDEDFAPGYYEDDAISMEIAKLGYRLLLVRDSFIYHVGSASFVKTGTNTLSLEHHKLFIQKYGFDILNYSYPCGAIISQIPFGRKDRFKVLHLGCGLGAELKAIRSFYPGAELFGIEKNPALREIVSATELVYPDVSALTKELSAKSIDLLIVDSDYLQGLTDNEKTMVASVCSDRAAKLTRLHTYDNYPFYSIKLVVWDKELESPGIRKLLSDRGIISITAPEDGLPDLIRAIGIGPEYVLTINSGSATIVPYLVAYFESLPVTDVRRRSAALMEVFLRRYNASQSYLNQELFLQESGLEMAIYDDCLEHLDEIKELLEEAKESSCCNIATDKNRLERMLCNDWNICGYVYARDQYGDYGIVSFFCFNNREKRIVCSATSWVATSFGINEYVANYLNNHGPVSEAKMPNRIRILIKADRSLSAIEDFLIGGNITTEYTDVYGDSDTGSLPTLLYSSGYHIIIYSLLQYDYDCWVKKPDACLNRFFEELDDVYEKAPGQPTIILMLGSENYFDTQDSLSCKLAELHEELNPMLLDYATENERIRIINATEFISGPADFAGDVNRFSVRVMSDIAERVCNYINEKVDELLNSRF